MTFRNRNGTSKAIPSARWCRIRSLSRPDATRGLATLLAFAAVLAAMACTSSPPAPTSSPPPVITTTPPALTSSAPPATTPPPSQTTSPPTSVPPLSTPPAGPTFGQLADAGKIVYTNSCAKCHGDKGQGLTAPAVIGPNQRLGKYNTAQGLLSFISAAMPLDAPGSLSQQQYQQLLCYMLVQNNLALPSSSFNTGQLGSITLK